MNKQTLLQCCERAAIEARKTSKPIADIVKTVAKAYDSVLLEKYGGVKENISKKPRRKGSPKTQRELNLPAGESKKEPTFPFGKYKGLTLDAVKKINPSYYSWAEGQGIIKKLKK